MINLSYYKFLSKYKVYFLITLIVFAIKLFLLSWAVFNFNFTTYSWNNLINIWDRWDAGVYKTIASSAYAQVPDMKMDQWAFLSHFPPLYPVMIFVVSLFGFSIPMSGILISMFSIIMASVMLYKLVLLEFQNKQGAILAVLFLNLFPTSYFTLSIYSEALFILLVISSFYFLRKENFPLAGLFAFSAILTRNVGIILIPTYALYTLYYIWKNRRMNWNLLYLMILPLLAVLVYMGINKFYYGDYFYFLNEKISFNTTKHFIFPFKESYYDLLAVFKGSNFSDQTFMTTKGWNAIAVFCALIVSFFGIRKLKFEYTLYSFGSILLFASLSWGISNARYVFPIFPIFMFLGSLENKILQGFILVFFTIGLLYFTTIFTSGAWAF